MTKQQDIQLLAAVKRIAEELAKIRKLTELEQEVRLRGQVAQEWASICNRYYCVTRTGVDFGPEAGSIHTRSEGM